MGLWESRDPQVTSHPYKPSLFGLCSAPNCARIEADHVRIAEEDDAECVVDHASIRATQVTGEAGVRWPVCPGCQVQVEPKMAAGEAQGVRWGPGRGALTERLRRRLEFVAHRTAKLDP